MNLFKGFDEKTYYKIAKRCNSSQLREDIKYMRMVAFKGRKVYSERLDEIAFFVGYCNKDHFRLVGIGVTEEMRGGGFGRFMLFRAINYSKEQGYKRIKTRTKDGVDFYQRCTGARIIDFKNGDYFLEIDI